MCILTTKSTWLFLVQSTIIILFQFCFFNASKSSFSPHATAVLCTGMYLFLLWNSWQFLLPKWSWNNYGTETPWDSEDRNEHSKQTNKQIKHHTLNIPQGSLVNGFEIYSIFSIISGGAIIYLFIYNLIQFLALRHWIWILTAHRIDVYNCCFKNYTNT